MLPENCFWMSGKKVLRKMRCPCGQVAYSTGLATGYPSPPGNLEGRNGSVASYTSPEKVVPRLLTSQV